MSTNRLQKLLFSEYCDFEDMVLLESPFAQTTKDGTGIRQVHLGLTPSKLLVATDVLPPIGNESFTWIPGLDPETETFELIAVYPVECVNLSVYRRKKRQSIKAHFCNNRVYYFELGGFEKRSMFWNLWVEKVKFLHPSNSGSSRSETSVATSSTASSLYVVERKLVRRRSGLRQIWYKFGPNLAIDNRLLNGIVNNYGQTFVRKWPNKYLFIGNEYEENPLSYKPISRFPSNEDFIKRKRSSKKTSSSVPSTLPLVLEKDLQFGDSVHVNRFGAGISEGCGTGLYMTVDDYIIPKTYSQSQMHETRESSISFNSEIDLDDFAENAVLYWEFYNFEDPNKYMVRHRRRYGFAPKPLFLYGLGPWSIVPGSTYSVQNKRASSEVCLSSHIADPELTLPVSKRQLIATVSCPCLLDEKKYVQNNLINTYRKPSLLFWTTNYWYRPVSARDAYGALRKHLNGLKSFHEKQTERDKKGRRCHRRILKKITDIANKDTDDCDDGFDKLLVPPKQQRKRCFMQNMLCTRSEVIAENNSRRLHTEHSLHHLKRVLSIDVTMSVWDFDSTCLAQHLTMIDKDLFLKISPSELDLLMWQKTSKNAPNVAAIIAFSYRLSCLIATEILKCDTEKMRARLISRFVNVANKCHRISNFHSCRTVLCGLQNPAIYRLRVTWAYVRKKHATKYQMFEFLCRLYRDPRMATYQKSFFIFSQNAPFMPYIGHVIAKLLNKVPDFRFCGSKKSSNISRQISLCYSASSNHHSIEKEENGTSNVFAKLFRIFSSSEQGSGDFYTNPNKSECKSTITGTGTTNHRTIYEYYKSLRWNEDDRIRDLVEATEFLEKCQLGCIHYNFNVSENVNTYLLKARYKEEQEIFFVSLGVESSRGDIQKYSKFNKNEIKR